MFDDDGFPMGIGHGVLYNLRYPNYTYCGGAAWEQGQKLLSIWHEFHDEYGVFCIDAANFNPIPPLNNAPANWSTEDLHKKASSESSSGMEDLHTS